MPFVEVLRLNEVSESKEVAAQLFSLGAQYVIPFLEYWDTFDDVSTVADPYNYGYTSFVKPDDVEISVSTIFAYESSDTYTYYYHGSRHFLTVHSVYHRNGAPSKITVTWKEKPSLNEQDLPLVLPPVVIPRR